MKRLLIIYLIIFTEILGFSMVIPVLPFLGLSLGLNAFQVGLILSLFSLCQLFASPITGKLSDRFGRKPVLIFSQASTLAGFLLLGFASSVWILILARLVDGLFGSNMTVSQAYISDVTDPKDRTKYYGYSSAVFGAGLIFGPVIGGTLSIFNFSFPMFLAAGISGVSIILVLIFLPESLTEKEHELKITFKDIIPIEETKRFFKQGAIRGIIISFFLYNFGFTLFISSFALFGDAQLQLNSQHIGIFLTWVGILRVTLQTVLIEPLNKKFGENRVLISGITALIISMSAIALSFNFWYVFLPLIFLAYGTGVGRPILTSKLSKCVNKEETGVLMGVNNSFTSLVQIISPILGGLFLVLLPSQVLPIVSAIIFLTFFISWRWTVGITIKRENTQENEN
ncbi:MAG: MFS transporter [Candidatus Lokiarchaeota archaeon]|nr:MFS transporter [Candidatus Lokiarchaeota archaeon]